ncbi:MAG: hypothetical protein M3N08_10705 [Pseudomonadota bacterium]|nr:hypothetical protein [Pseudomonadota bacterium]
MKKPRSKHDLPETLTGFEEKLGLTPAQAKQLKELKSPQQIQDYINSIPINFEPEGDTCLSATEAIRQRRAHCIEGAFIAACALWMHGRPPLLMDLKAHGDDDHVVALYKHNGFWGAISKSNHVWLRWRDPVYRTLRELALSYFHEYVSRQSKTLWSYSASFDLRRFAPETWISGKESCWAIATALDQARHYPLITAAQARNLRHRDPIEMRAGELVDFRKSGQ